jgi:hypothetical protein
MERLTEQNVIVTGFGTQIVTRILPNMINLEDQIRKEFIIAFKKEFGTNIKYMEDGSFIINGRMIVLELNMFLTSFIKNI